MLSICIVIIYIIILLFHLNDVGTFFTDEESEYIVVKKHVQGHPVKLRFESQGHPWYSDSKACELGNTTCSSRTEPAPASQHLWSPVVSTSWYFHDTSLSPIVSLSLTSTLFLSAIASPFPLLSISLLCVSPIHALQESVSLCGKEQTWLHIGSIPLAPTFVLCCWCLVMMALHLCKTILPLVWNMQHSLFSGLWSLKV